MQKELLLLGLKIRNSIEPVIVADWVGGCLLWDIVCMYNDMMSRNRRKATNYIKKGTSATTQFILFYRVCLLALPFI